VACRFFAVTLFGNYFHVWGVPAWGPWNDSRLHFREERALDLSLKLPAGAQEHKIRTRADFDAAIEEAQRLSAPRTLWIPERLIGDVRTLWEDLLAFRNEIEKTRPFSSSR
jgi:hypothetical protein